MASTDKSRSGRRSSVGSKAESSNSGPGLQQASLFSGYGDFGVQTTGATVVRLNREARNRGAAPFEATGMRIASSRDFQDTALPPDLDGADVVVFERFGIAIVDSEPDRLQNAMSVATAEKSILGHRPERIFRALGMEMAEGSGGAAAGALAAAGQDGAIYPTVERSSGAYLRGYLGGVAGLVGHLLGEGGGLHEGAAGSSLLVGSGTSLAYDEGAFTWGLQATNVTASRCSGRGIRVAILDTGLDLFHPDFAGRTIVSKSFVPGQDVQDGNGHGTHCAGTACGPLKPTGVPRYGIAHEAELYVGKVLSNAGSGSDRTVIGGLEWALDNGCHVISMSLGSPADLDAAYIQEYEDIGADALRSGSLIVAASGNESERPGFVAPVGSPANCPSIFSVAAVDQRLLVAPFSCGKRSNLPGGDVDIAAPGDDVFSSYPMPRRYHRLRGTSMATPHVAGIAALYAEADQANRGLALWGALVRGRRFIGGSVADIGAGLAQSAT